MTPPLTNGSPYQLALTNAIALPLLYPRIAAPTLAGGERHRLLEQSANRQPSS